MNLKGYQRLGLLRLKIICRNMRQIHPETGEYLAIFQNTNPILFFMFLFVLFDLLYQRGYQR